MDEENIFLDADIGCPLSEAEIRRRRDSEGPFLTHEEVRERMANRTKQLEPIESG